MRTLAIADETKQIATGISGLLSFNYMKKSDDILRWLAAPQVDMDHDAACRKREAGIGE